jgi:acetylglutamate kinase
MIVVKYGGHALPKAGVPDEVLKVIANYFQSGREIVLVHGGGPQVDAELAIHGIESEMVSGYRKTTPEIFEVVQAILSGQICRTLVNQLIGYGANAVGLSSSDGGSIRATQMMPEVNGTPVDIGLVGDITCTNPALLQLLIANRYLPVVSPVAVNSSGQGLNLNGDLAAGAIAGALQADQVIFMTDVRGIYRSYPDETSIISTCTAQDLRDLQPTFAAGMIPKSKAALYALENGAKRARVIDGRNAKNLIAALDGFGGTVVLP